MNLNEIIIQLCRLKECEDIPLKYKADLQEIVHSLNYIQIGQTLGLDADDVRERMLQIKEPDPISVSPLNGTMPTWDDMCFIKDMFWDEEDCVIQYHPPIWDKWVAMANGEVEE